MFFRNFANFLNQIDVMFFYFVNHNLSSEFMDWLMKFFTDFNLSRKIVLLVLAFLALLKWRLKALWIIFLMGLAVGLSDLTSSQILKKLVGRIRPCHVLENVNLVVNCSGSFSFPSSHCANIFGALTVLMRMYPYTIAVLLPMGLLVALSRVYVGVHYPSDALGGIVVGVLCGLFVVYVGKFVETKLENTDFICAYRKINSVSLMAVLKKEGRGFFRKR